MGSTTRTYPGPTFDSASQATGAWRAGDSCHGRKAWWIVTPTLQHWQNIGETMGSFVATANESDNNQWKKYRSFQAGDGPVLKIWTNGRPHTPVELDPGYAQHRLGPSIALSAKHNDPEGDPAQLAFGLWSYPARELVWAQWSPWVNSGQRASVTTSSMPDGWYYFRVAAHDGFGVSDFSWEDHLVFIDTVPPNTPTELSPGPNSTVGTTFTASARYTEPYGWPGELLFWVNNEANTSYVTHAFSPTVGNGQEGSKALNLPVGKYNLYVYGYDLGQLSMTPMGPHPITVATRPTAPTGVTAIEMAEMSKVSWTPPGSNGGSPITKMRITAIDQGGGTSPAPIECAGSCLTSHTAHFEGLLPNHTYKFVVAAMNVVGGVLGVGANSVPSNAVSALSGDLLTPTNVLAIAGDQQATVSWTPSAVGGLLPGVTAYTVRAYNDGDDQLIGAPLEGISGTQATFPGLPNGSPVYFRVIATTAFIVASSESAQSNTVTPAGNPSAPTNVVAHRGDHEVAVLWSPPNANGAPITDYRINVYKDENMTAESSFPAAGDTTLTYVVGLMNEETYRFTVQARNSSSPNFGAESAFSDFVIPAGAPFAPSNVNAVALGPGEALVQWGPPLPLGDGTSGNNGDPIVTYRITASPFCSECLGVVVGGNDYQATIVGLSANTSYTFQVVAANAIGESPTSGSSNSIQTASNTPSPPPSGAPGAPVNVRATMQHVLVPNSFSYVSSTATVTWLAPSVSAVVDTYRVTAHPGGATVDVPSSNTSAQIEGLEGRFTTYRFTVAALNSIGLGEEAHSQSLPSLKATADRHMTEVLGSFLSDKSQAQGPYEWDDDGCSLGPVKDLADAYFVEPCYRHDFGYRNYGHGLSLGSNEDTRKWIDNVLFDDMWNSCLGDPACYLLATTGWTGLRNVGQTAFYG